MPRKRFELSRPAANRDSGRRLDVEESPEIVWLPAVVAVLVVSRFFLPAESAAQGETLWIVLLWLICGLVWLFATSRNKESVRRPDAIVAGIGLLVGGHVISALSVLLTEGDKRAAMNMLWEWVGIAVAAMLIRVVMRTRTGRDQLLSVILISGVVLAGLGLWQHFVWYPRIASQFAELESLQGELQRAEPSGDIAGDTATMRSRLRRVEALRRELGWTPGTHGGAERMFRDRVQASTEPIGQFALTNTFAGLLLVTGFLGLAVVIVAAQRRVSLPKWGGVLAGLLIVGYCLWLTKSRTALVGGIGGLAVLGLFIRRQSFARIPIRWVLAGAAVVLIGMPVAASLSGSLDRQVLTEALKSLLYRVGYWQATGRLIADHPLLGVGPGNFRQHYLQHKLPGSSEEILDPHNLFLDVWANGGLIALMGLLCLLGIAARRSGAGAIETEGEASEPEGEADTLQSGVLRKGLLLGGIGTASLVLAAGCELLGGTIGGGQWLVLGLGWWVAAYAVSVGGSLAKVGMVLPAALAGLVIHLTGAGGIAMPAILQVLVILVLAIADPVVAEPTELASEEGVGKNSLGRWTVPSMLLGGLALLAACLVTATLPVTKATAAMNIGRAAWLVDGQPLAAAQHFLQAADEDPLSPNPWQELAGVRFARWTRTTEDDDFEQAVAAQREAIARDPRNASRWRTLAQLWMHRYEREPEQEFARAAYQAMLEAVKRYPHLATAQAELATAAQQAREPARAQEAARTALRLDVTNRQRGHVDKYLTAEQLTELRAMLPEEDADDT